MNEQTSKLTIELAKVLMSTMQEHVPRWQRAFIRFEASEDHHGCNGSYVTPEGIFLFDVFQFKQLFTQMKLLGVNLRETLTIEDKKFCVFLLSVNSDFEYEIDYEWNDIERWRITKMNGATGIPVGVALSSAG